MSSADELAKKLEKDLEDRLAGLSSDADAGKEDDAKASEVGEKKESSESAVHVEKDRATEHGGPDGSVQAETESKDRVMLKEEEQKGADEKLERKEEVEGHEEEPGRPEVVHATPNNASKDDAQSESAEVKTTGGSRAAEAAGTAAEAADQKHGGGIEEAEEGKEDAQASGADTQDSRDDRPMPLSLHSSNFETTQDKDRDLPAPPTPAKEDVALPSTQEATQKPIPATPEHTKNSEQATSSEVEAVARAFGKTSLAAEASPSTGSFDAPVSAGVSSSQVLSVPQQDSTSSQGSPLTPKSGGIRIGKGPPPSTPASEEKPFDFNRFLEQMRHRSAGPVGEYVRSFIKGFTKKPYRTQDQTKLIFDFLDFIAGKMRECEVWANVSDTEFENATEAMEKLVMNRLYAYTFSPAVRREGKWSVQTDDLERDRVLKQRVNLFTWITEEHLDVPRGDHSKGFIDFAMQELLKINHYKAPRDKLICILNCCKVIFGLIRHLSTEENADTFIPVLIFVVLRANPDHLISNVEYIGRFRNQERLSSESGYYLSSLMGAIAFIETMDYTSLSNITQEQFEKNVGDAVQNMSTEQESLESSPGKERLNQSGFEKNTTSGGIPLATSSDMTPSSSQGGGSGDEAARALPIAPMAATLAEDTRAFFQRTGEAARAGLGASFGKPMGALGKLFQEGLDGPRMPSGSQSNPEAGTPARNESPSPSLPTSNSARSRMWGLFGVDDDGKSLGDQASPSRPQQRPISSSHSGTASPSSTPNASATRPSSGFNLGSWSRSFRGGMDAEEEPQTPHSDELRQGPFSALASQGGPRIVAQQQGGGTQQPNAPRAQRLRPAMQGYPGAPPSQPPQHARPTRKQSVDPYALEDEAPEDSGVRTPTDDGSFDDHEGAGAGMTRLTGDTSFSSSTGSSSSHAAGATAAAAARQQQLQQDQQRHAKSDSGSGARSRFSDLGGFLPSFLQETNSPSAGRGSREQQGQQQQELTRGPSQGAAGAGAGAGVSPSSEGMDDVEASAAQAEIDRAHLAAGVETLRSIFPSTEPDVCQMVLEGCHGDVQASIDRLLEMS